MPEEIDVPTEHLHEHMEHQAQHSPERWIIFVALSSALLAVCAAVSALLAGHHANEAVIEQIQSSDQWAYYQAKGIKAAVLEGKTEVLAGLGKEVSEKDREKLKDYKAEQAKIKTEAQETAASSALHLKHHHTLAKSVTLFQIAIALGAIAALTRRKTLWLISLAFGAVGLLFFALGLV